LWTSGLISLPAYIYPGLHDQPCFITRALYTYKTKRFQTADDLPASSIEEISYQHYLQSGQCPNAFNFQRLLAEMTADNISTDGLSLNDYPSFTSVILSNNNFDVASAVIPLANWETTINGAELTANVVVPAAPNFECTITLDATSIPVSTLNWANVFVFSGLEATGTTPDGNYTFSIIVSVNNGTSISNHQITGTTCFDILNCQFQGVCDANDLALSVQNIMSMLASQNDLDPANPDVLAAANYNLFGYTTTDPVSGLLIQDPTQDYESQMNLSLLNLIQSANTQLVWDYNVSTNTVSISPTLPASTPSLRLDLHIISTSPSFSNLGLIAYFDNIQSEHEHYFGMDAYDVSGNLLTTVHGEALLWDGTIHTPVEM